MSRIKNLNVCERPRERLSGQGVAALSDEELVALLLGTGGRTADVMTLALQVREMVDLARGMPDVNELQKIGGIGVAKASLIVAALEFSRRRIRPEGIAIRQASDAVPLLQHLAAQRQEHFIAISLNGAHEVIATRVVTVGLVNTTQVHPREVFADAIVDRACAIVVAHNHPSGDLSPSEADKEVTKTLQAAGKLLGITLLDHIIFSRRGYLSFRETGLIVDGK